MRGMFGGHERIENRSGVLSFQPSVRGDFPVALAMGSRIHQCHTVAATQQNQCVLHHAHAIVRHAMKQQDPGAVRLRRPYLPSSQRHPIAGADVEGFCVAPHLRERNLCLLHQVGSQGPPHRMQKRWSHQPAENDRDKHRGDQQRQ